MVENVLAVLDGGPGDAIVQETTVKLAHAIEGRVTVLGLTDPNKMTTREAAPAGAMHYKQMADQRRYKELKAQIGREAERLAKACEDFGAKSRIVMSETDPVAALQDRWDDHDLLVLGREKRGQGTRMLSRKQLMKVLRDCPQPILVASSAESANPESVAIAYDGSQEAKQALRHFLQLGFAIGRRVEIVCVNEEQVKAQDLAAEAAALARSYGVDARTFAVGAQRQPLTVLANRLVALRPGSMVLPSVQDRGWRDLLFGSLTGRLLRGSGATLYFHR